MSVVTPSIKIDTSLNVAGGMSATKNIYGAEIISQKTDSVGLYSNIQSNIQYLVPNSPVFVLGAHNMSPWNTSFVDTNASYIWNTSGANISAPFGITIQFQRLFNSSTSYTGRIYIRVDDQFTFYFNNELIGSASGWRNTYSFDVNILVGVNLINIEAINLTTANNPAGLIASLTNLSTSTVVLRSDSSWVWSTGIDRNDCAYSGVVWKNPTSYYMGLNNESTTSDITGMTINVAVQNTSFNSSTLRGDIRTNQPPFYFWTQSSFKNTINFYPTYVSIANTTSSTNTTSGAIVCSGGMGVAENSNIGGTLSLTNLSTNFLNVMDGLNQGTIDQVSTELTFSSSGNRVAIGANNQLLFKTNSTGSQITAYRGRHIIDPVEINAHLRNWIVIKQSLSLQNTDILTLSESQVQGGSVNLTCIGTLVKGQVIRGIFVWLSASQTGGCQFGLYRASSTALVASTPANGNVVSGVNFINLSTPYTVDETTTYYFGTLITGSTTMYVLSTLASSYLSYGLTTNPSTGQLSRYNQYTNSTYTSLPSSLSGVGFTLIQRNNWCGVYGNFALNIDSSLTHYLPFDNTYSGKEMWNYRKYFVDGTITNDISSLSVSGNYSIDTTNEIVGPSCLQYYRILCTYNNITVPDVNIHTICFWIKTSGSSVAAVRLLTINTHPNGNYSAFQAYGSGTAGAVNRYSNDSQFGSSQFGGTLAWTNTWHHWCVVVNNGTTRHYRNASLIATASFTPVTGQTALRVAVGHGSTPIDSYNQYIDDLRLYSRALSDEEILSIYNYRGTL